MQVWAVTVGGRVVVRQGVTSSCPEGKGWLHVPTPVGREVAQLSVAPSGLVWAVTWGGGALIRLGVARLEPSGLAWVEVEPPRPEQPLVGTLPMSLLPVEMTLACPGAGGGGAGQCLGRGQGRECVAETGRQDRRQHGAAGQGDQVPPAKTCTFFLYLPNYNQLVISRTGFS